MKINFSSKLFKSLIIHERFHPFKNRFSYMILSLYLDYSEITLLNKKLSIFSYNKFNIFSFYEKDHGYRDNRLLKEFVSDILNKNKISFKSLNIKILCIPRILGYAFNPLSVIFCFDKDNLISILYEVKINSHAEFYKNYLNYESNSDNELLNSNTSFNEVFFEDVKVPLSSRVGEENRGWYIAVTSLDFERSGIHLIFGIQGVYEKLIHFLKSKLASKIGIDTNRLKKIARTLTDTKLELEVARLLSYRITSMQSAGLVPNYEASMAKCMGSELGQFHARRAINALGLYGQLLKDSKHSVLNGDIPNSYMYTVSRTIAGGTSDIQRNIIATRGLGLPRS